MCSILGQINFGKNRTNNEELKKLNSLLKHRGPDDEGYFNDEYVSLAFNRLSIIDLQTGNQPIKTYNIVSIFNGEIYNFKELKKELIDKGYKFKTNSDSEVIPVAYKAWGTQFLKKLRGMFAICIYDLDKKKIFLVRDQVGIKPLYYFLINDGIIFASEIKSLINHSKFKKKINYNAITSYLSHRYTVNNKSLFFKNLKQVNEGSFIEISIKNQKISEHEYYNLTVKTESTDRGENYYLELIEDKLQQSVNRHLISDVPISVFLSGGLDSSLLSSMTSKKLEYEINTFSVGFDNINYDESNFANLVSKYIGSNHNNIKIQKSNFLENIKKIIKIKSTPASIPHEYPLYLLSSEIKKKNKVVLSGEGADEFFGGYARMQKSAVDFIKLKKFGRFSKINLIKKIFSLDSNFDYKKNFLNYFFYKYNWFSNKDIKNLFLDNLITDENFNDAQKPWLDLINKNKNLNLFDLSLLFFQKNHLKCLLNRLDSLTMANSLEARVPFLDLDLIESINSVPFKYKIKWNSNFSKFASLFSNNFNYSEKFDKNKYLLREISKKYLPTIISNRKKSGFPLPMNDWMNSLQVKEILLDQKTLSRGLYNEKYLNKIIETKDDKDLYDFNGKKIWMIINLEIWMREFIDK